MKTLRKIIAILLGAEIALCGLSYAITVDQGTSFSDNVWMIHKTLFFVIAGLTCLGGVILLLKFIYGEED